MAKLFFEVFPTLKITGEMSALLKETEITKVASNSAQNALRIYLESTRLIPKPEIYHIEQEIRQQLFPHKEVAVKIIEKFNLSSQYTPEKLMAVYRESILEEIRNYSVLLYNLMRCSKMEFDREDHMILTLEDTIVATERSNELIDILEKIICERCGLKLMIEPQYEKPAENDYLKSADSQIETEVAHIVARTAAARTQNTDGMEQPAIKEAEAQGLSLIKNVKLDEATLKLKSYEALMNIGQSESTKIIIPSELQGLASAGVALKEIMKDKNSNK